MLRLFDADNDGRISREEWFRAVGRGVALPDFGVCYGVSIGLFDRKRKTDEQSEERGRV